MTSSVGFLEVTVPSLSAGESISTLVFYPSSGQESQHQFGPFSLSVVDEGEVKLGVYPLVVISHGNGGSPWAYRNLARSLASAGFIVALPKHPGNNKDDNSQAGTAVLLQERPEHIRAVIRWFSESACFKAHFLMDQVALIGHSMGGYTALAVAGGRPRCLPRESLDGDVHPVETEKESSVKAVVLLAPATIWFEGAGALTEVDCPILLMVGDQDSSTGPCCPILERSGFKEAFLPYGYHASLVINGVRHKSQVSWRVINNAGHFAFVSPFPERMVNPGFPPSQDPVGFDRERFQAELSESVISFLNKNLVRGVSRP